MSEFDLLDALAELVKENPEGFFIDSKDVTSLIERVEKAEDESIGFAEILGKYVAEARGLRARVNNPLCNNCGVPLTTKSGVVVHLAGPQKGMTTCALNPYGTYVADDGNYFSTAVSDD